MAYFCEKTVFWEWREVGRKDVWREGEEGVKMR